MSTARRLDRTEAPRRPPALGGDLIDRAPPFDLQAEIGVLGSIVLLPDVLDDVVMILRPDDFYDDANRRLFAHMLALHEANKKIDLTLLMDRLKSAGDLEVVGGAAHLSKIVNAVPHAAHAIFYAEIVRQKSTFRSLILAATEILRDAYDEAQEGPQLLGQAEQKIFSILDNRGDSSVQPIKEILHEAMDRLDARMKGEHDAGGVDYGFEKLDEFTGGLQKSSLVVLAARPSMGKTAFAMNVAEDVAVRQNIPTLFVSLEMSSLELADRLLCSTARVNGHRMRNGTISDDDRRRLVEKSSMLSQTPLYVDDAPSRTVTEIAAAARRIKRRQGRLGLIIIDYLQLIEPDNARDPRQEQVAKIARRLKGLAREMEVPVMCLAQLNRQAEVSRDNRPKLSHLRESGAIEQDADVVLFVHREEVYCPIDKRQEHTGKAQIIIGKQRNGPANVDVNLFWRKEITKFETPPPEHFHEFDVYNDSSSQSSQGDFD
ncbi:MAG TPA: replicative DNA helicase [Pirellulaceae bacterium]|nr:replicative DNA helicase [Pirellulaceae bacterium]